MDGADAARGSERHADVRADPEVGIVDVDDVEGHWYGVGPINRRRLRQSGSAKA
jgi:hypothetical protein